MRTQVLFAVAFCLVFVTRIFSQGCNALCNGGFDDPTAVTTTGLLTSLNCWSTTASDGKMEVWASGYGNVASYSGIQFVELNATQAATMYQDFPVQSGITYTIGFAHRGRSGTDTMQVSYGPSGGPYTSLGKYADGTSGWGYYTATFTPTSTTNFRILFTPIYWSGGNVAIGNFIDAISVTGPYTFTTSVNSASICSGSSITLQAQGATNYVWSNTSTLSSIVVSPTSSTTYTVVGSVNNCSQTVISTVVVSPTLNVTVTGPSVQCVGSAFLVASGASNFTWNPGNYVGSTYYVSPSTTTQYTVNGQTGACSGTKIFTLTILPTPTVTIQTPTVSACPGSVTVLSAGGASTYVWQPGGISGSTSSVSPTNNTTYTVTGTSSLGCAGSATASIFVKPVPTISFSTYSITCASLGSATVLTSGGLGPFNYTWMPSAQTGSIASGLNPNTYTATIFDLGTGCTTNSTSIFTSLIPLTGTLNNTSSLTCNNVNVGIGSFSNLAGGSPNQNYFWSNGTNTFTNHPVTTLGAGNWTVTVTDALTACQINSVFTITQPPPLVLNLSSSAFTSCAQTSVNLSSTLSGGTPGYTQQWIQGSQQVILSPTTLSTTVTQSLAGNYIYTLTANDSYSCQVQNTVAVNFIPNPTLSINNVSICPLQTGTLNISGATNYTWTSPALTLTGNSFTDSPTSTTEYTIVGTAQSCTSSATASIIVKPLPGPFTLGTNTLCEGQSLSIGAFGGVEFDWLGPSGFFSASQYINVSPASPTNSGVYQVTVTAANACTAATSASVTVYPTPSISVVGSTVCTNQNLNLQANSFTGSTYLWNGPLGFSSNVQNPSIALPSVMHTGIYTVTVTSPFSCTNTANAHASVVALPNPSISSNGTVCLNKTITFTASGGNGGVYTWSGPLGFNSPNTNTLIANAMPGNAGTYTLSVLLGPCVNTATQIIVVNPLPSFTLTSNSPCEKDNLELYSGGIGNASGYQWKGPFPLTSTQPNPVFPNASQAMAGEYTLTIIDGNGCVNSNTHTVSIRSNPTLTPISTTVCLNQPATLKVEGAQSYVWTGPGSYVSRQANALIPIAGSAVPTIYTVTGTAANQCTATTVATLSTFKLPEPYIQVSPSSTICLKETIYLQGGGALVYSWNGPGGLSITGQKVAFEARNLSYQGTYTLMAIDNNGCKNYTTTLITVNDLPRGYLAGNKMSGCAPFDADLRFYSPSPQVKAKWYYDTKTITSDSFALHFPNPGQYTISGIFNDTLTGCNSTEVFTIEAYAQPKADFIFSPEKPTEISELVTFTNTSFGEKLSNTWYLFHNNGPTFYTQHASYNFDEPGVYPIVLEIEDVHGCRDTVVKSVRVEAEFTFYVPNAFTPNEDDRNDVFLPIIRGVKLYNLQIFDRWGERVFITSELGNGWDGTFRGKVCEDGTYVWKIQVSTNAGDEKVRTGHILLYR